MALKPLAQEERTQKVWVKEVPQSPSWVAAEPISQKQILLCD